MIPLTVAEVAAACRGRPAGVSPEATVLGVTIDSRTAGPGDLFVAIAGEHADGRAFASDAVARGAVAVLVRSDADVHGSPAICVRDPGQALGLLAAEVRRRSAARVIAITGSSGKTCTKQLTAAAIGARFRSVTSRASYNNELGVPLTICMLEPDSDVLVAEVGSRGPGHIAALLPMLQPEVGVVTNVGPAHFEMFGSLDVTAAAKAELVEALPSDGVAVLNADDPRVRSMATRTSARVVAYGTSRWADVRAENVELDARGRPRFDVVTPTGRAAIALRMHGEHMVPNALAAIAAAGAIGVPLDTAAGGVAAAVAVPWRMEILDAPNEVTVINDAYNSNPASASAALKTLAGMRPNAKRTWAVLGVMAELGPIAMQEHDRLGRLAVRLGIDRLVAVGEDARATFEAARLEGMAAEDAAWVRDAEEALAVIAPRLAAGDVVLVKASRVVGMETLAAALAEGGA